MFPTLAIVAAPFAQGRPVFHETAVAPYRFENTIVRVHFALDRRAVLGDETAVVAAKRAGLTSLPFNSYDIAYRRITVNGKPAAYTLDNSRQSLQVALPHASRGGERFNVEFLYDARPTRGLYFVLADRAYPHENPEIWTQGEATDNRRWFPTWDEPNEKTPSELIITVPRGWTAIGNGALRSHTHSASSETWDWVSIHPKSTYLIAFAAGPLARYHNQVASLDVDSYVAPSLASLNATCFRNTAAMIAFYNARIGVAYPFAKYDQIAVERFTFGGMENASDTILTDHALHPAVEDGERSCDLLISHELAQQWFGDDVTMSDWSNAWINEGFATYFDELWTEKSQGQAAFEYARYQAQQLFIDETQRYYRPIVDYQYDDPLDQFDASGHERAAEVLHMLRVMFGDRRFFAALHAYLVQYSYRNADTHDFFAAFGRYVGADLSWFERQWMYRAAYPEFTVNDRYDARTNMLTVRVRQANHDGSPFRADVAIEVYAGSHVVRTTARIDRNDQTFHIRNVPSTPRMVLFDPNDNLLRALTYPQTLARLAYQLRNAQHVGDREWALAQLATLRSKNAPDTAAQAVCEATLHDPFYGVRADASAVAAALNREVCVDAALHDSDVRVRIAAETAASTLAPAHADTTNLLQAMTHDANPDIVAAALTALGSLKVSGAYDELHAALNRETLPQEVAVGAISGLANLGDPRAFDEIEQRTAYGTPEQERNAAVGAIAVLAQPAGKRVPVRQELIALAMHDPLIGTRLSAARALDTLGDANALSALRTIASNDSQEIVRITAWRAAWDLAHRPTAK